jgi:hypothetical protein
MLLHKNSIYISESFLVKLLAVMTCDRPYFALETLVDPTQIG